MEDLFDSAFGFDAGPETNGVGPGYRYGTVLNYYVS
jgi:hypothetical protein